MIKVKTAGQILPIKNGTALPSPSPANGYAFFHLYFVVPVLIGFSLLAIIKSIA
jgi:hypothetical protein